MDEEHFDPYGIGERRSSLSSETISDNEITPEDIECENVNFGEFQRKDSIDYEIHLGKGKEDVTTEEAKGDFHERSLQLIEVIKEDEPEEDEDEDEQEMVSCSGSPLYVKTYVNSLRSLQCNVKRQVCFLLAGCLFVWSTQGEKVLGESDLLGLRFKALNLLII